MPLTMNKCSTFHKHSRSTLMNLSYPSLARGPYKSGRLSLNTPQPSLVDLSASRSKLAVTKPSRGTGRGWMLPWGLPSGPVPTWQGGDMGKAQRGVWWGCGRCMVHMCMFGTRYCCSCSCMLQTPREAVLSPSVDVDSRQRWHAKSHPGLLAAPGQGPPLAAH